MSGAGVNRPDPERWLRRAWLALIALSLALVGSVAFLRYRHDAALAGYRAAQQAQSADCQREFERSVRDPLVRRARGPNELAQALFPGRTPTTLPSADPNEVRWADPERGIVYLIRFRPDGRRAGFGVSQLPLPPPPTPWLLRLLPERHSYSQRWAYHALTLTNVAILCAALVALSFVPTRVARPLAQAHLALAWFGMLGWLLDPRYPLSFRGILSNRTFLWGALMLIGSMFAASFVMSRARQLDPRRCRACGYDLTGNVSGVCPECGSPIVGGGDVAEATSA